MILRRFYSARTPLYDWHLSKNALMTRYLNWEIPNRYEGKTVRQSYIHTLKRVSLFDRTYMNHLDVRGEDRVPFLETLLVSDIQNLGKGNVIQSLITNEKGGILANPIVIKSDHDVTMIMEPGNDIDHIKRTESEWRSRGKDIYVNETNRSLISLQGPKSTHLVSICCIQDKSIDIYNIPYMKCVSTYIRGRPVKLYRHKFTGQDGYDIIGYNEDITTIVKELTSFVECKPAGLSVYEAIRIESGVCAYGYDIDESVTPVEAGLSHMIDDSRRFNPSFKFAGWQIIIDQLRSKRLFRKRMGIKTDIISNDGLPRYSVVLNDMNEPVGMVTSSVLSPSTNVCIGMGYIEHPFYHDFTKGLYINNGKRGDLQNAFRVSLVPPNPH